MRRPTRVSVKCFKIEGPDVHAEFIVFVVFFAAFLFGAFEVILPDDDDDDYDVHRSKHVLIKCV